MRSSATELFLAGLVQGEEGDKKDVVQYIFITFFIVDRYSATLPCLLQMWIYHYLFSLSIPYSL